MLFSACFADAKNLGERNRPKRPRTRLIAASQILSITLLSACGGSHDPNVNSQPSNSRPDAAANTPRPSANQFSSIEVKEPERYSVAMTVSAQQTASDVPAPMLTQQLTLSRFDVDRRWTFTFPAPLGQVAYLEKSGLKYVILFDRKQYAEITSDALSIPVATLLSPRSISERLKSNQYEKLGLEPVNGRTAVKYRIAPAADSPTRTDGVVLVDQETGLPLRSELNKTGAGNTTSRVVVELRDVRLSPDRAQFDVPAGMRKISQQEAKPQLEAVANALRPFADLISGAR
jgi:hypothetical protein